METNNIGIIKHPTEQIEDNFTSQSTNSLSSMVPALRTEDLKNRLLIIYSHGFGDNVKNSYALLQHTSAAFSKNVDFSCVSFSNSKQKNPDIIKPVINEFKSRVNQGYSPENIILWGSSRGAYASTAAAQKIFRAEGLKPRLIIQHSPVYSMQKAVKSIASFIPAMFVPRLRWKMNSIEFDQEIKDRIVQFHSSKDRLVRTSDQKKLEKIASNYKHYVPGGHLSNIPDEYFDFFISSDPEKLINEPDLIKKNFDNLFKTKNNKTQKSTDNKKEVPKHELFNQIREKNSIKDLVEIIKKDFHALKSNIDKPNEIDLKPYAFTLINSGSALLKTKILDSFFNKNKLNLQQDTLIQTQINLIKEINCEISKTLKNKKILFNMEKKANTLKSINILLEKTSKQIENKTIKQEHKKEFNEKLDEFHSMFENSFKRLVSLASDEKTLGMLIRLISDYYPRDMRTFHFIENNRPNNATTGSSSNNKKTLMQSQNDLIGLVNLKIKLAKKGLLVSTQEGGFRIEG